MVGEDTHGDRRFFKLRRSGRQSLIVKQEQTYRVHFDELKERFHFVGSEKQKQGIKLLYTFLMLLLTSKPG